MLNSRSECFFPAVGWTVIGTPILLIGWLLGVEGKQIVCFAVLFGILIVKDVGMYLWAYREWGPGKKTDNPESPPSKRGQP